jgi:glutamine amidotransferase
MANRVAVINHGLSNLNSIVRALEVCGAVPVVTNSPAELAGVNRIVLPGVGAFGAAIERLRALGMDRALVAEVDRRSVPVLGICLGMQLLADRSTEGGEHAGLGLIPGDVERLQPSGAERVPHVGWNSVTIERDDLLFSGIAPGSDFYFVHSFHLRCRSPQDVLATTDYGGGFTAAARHGSVWAVQFHPEKSQRVGLQLLRNFLEA